MAEGATRNGSEFDLRPWTTDLSKDVRFEVGGLCSAAPRSDVRHLSVEFACLPRQIFPSLPVSVLQGCLEKSPVTPCREIPTSLRFKELRPVQQWLLLWQTGCKI